MAEKKCILLTKHKRLHTALSQAIKQKRLQCETEISSLSNIDHIARMIKLTKNTSFLRDAYSEFLKQNNSTPLCVILDYRIDFGLPIQMDPDQMKLVRTFLISSLIVNDMTDLEYNLTNMIFVGSPVHLKHFEKYKSEPESIFKGIETDTQKLNLLLEKIRNNREEARKYFYFDYLIIDERNDVFPAVKKLEEIIETIHINKQKLINKEKTKHQTEIISGQYDAAKVLYKLSAFRLYLEGKIYNIENNPKFDKYEENIIYIIGHYVHNNCNEVNKKIEKFIIEYLPKLRKLSLDTDINISLNSHTIIDGGVTHGLNILLSTKLKDFKNIRLITSPVNYSKMERSPGFIFLKNYIFKKL
ncbi:MAG: hypothetical protein KKH98_11945 [Spirochaetes bacterium]|nr:hypothetical protein [Spirochaetota bacterium]